MVGALLEKSEANEEEKAQREELAKKIKKAEKGSGSEEQTDGPSTESETDDAESSVEEDAEATTDYAPSEQSMAITEGSFVKIKSDDQAGNSLPEDESQEPDFYDVDVLGRRPNPFSDDFTDLLSAWDSPASPLQ